MGVGLRLMLVVLVLPILAYQRLRGDLEAIGGLIASLRRG